MSKVPLRPSRRVILNMPIAAVLGAGLAGCGGSSGDGSGSASGTSRTPARSRSDLARDRAAAAETDLIARYDAVAVLPFVASVPGLAGTLDAVRAEHAAHLAAIRDGYSVAPAPPSASRSASPPGSTTPSVPSTGSSAVSSTPSSNTPEQTSALSGIVDAKSLATVLATAEQDAAARLTDDIMSSDGRTAQLLASIAACEAGHSALLLEGTA